MPDLPSSPRKTVSSVSQNARSQTQKKPGAPKPKGAVRAKSGCYTCRIRRKKCDEQPNPEGSCQTCVRLRLQCLGFGAKRPDWMRENNSVTELREKIKTFLASQGMIKGHSGSGPRNTDGDPPVLVLVDHIHSNPSSPSTPPTNPEHRPQGQISYVRDGPHYQPPLPPQPEQQPYHQPPPAPSTWQSHVPELAHPAHPDARGPHALPPIIYSDPTNSMLSSTSLVNINPSSSSWPNGSSYLPPSYSTSTPQLMSSFGHHYYDGYADDDVPNSPMPTVVGPSISTLPPGSFQYPTIPREQTPFIDHYLRNVLPVQYLLAPKSITDFMFKLIQEYPTARDAACVLSALHIHLMRLPSATSHAVQYARTTAYETLRRNLRDKTDYTEGDAMAGLQVVSSFLFTGGTGEWNPFLDIAARYVSDVLNHPRYYGPDDVLKNCSEPTRFIIKTTMWFDVLASVTTQQIPRFLRFYRELFNRTGAYIDDPSTSLQLSMLPVMGCDNHIVLALAEISALAHWKEAQVSSGTLSVPDLVARGIKIEKQYLLPDAVLGVVGPDHSTLNGGRNGVRSSMTAADLEIQQRRRFTNEIFRTSAGVYLHTVLSGDNPRCPDIVQRVSATLYALRQIPTNPPSVHRGVIRSVVFGICISGCLTESKEQRAFLLSVLESQQGETMGNVAQVKHLLESVWAQQDLGRPVNWREVMRKSSLLLV